MTTFTLHTLETAPEASRPLLEKSFKGFGRIPGLHGVLAESPQLLAGYQTLHQLVTESSFDTDEMNVVWLTINVEHACHYCVPAHTGIAKGMKVSDDIINALRDETPLPSDRLEALRTFTLEVVRKRGEVSEEDLERFFSAGYNNRHVLDVILVLSQKVISNYVNHMARTPVDDIFHKYAWQKKA